ncbi:MAG: AbrB/MazE/SpoVT family DNA-binding domain-containing protein [Defluviitaleaceae bacterium]|nr:AbrB/MazE/SpoVT family DNA-binding domain-containing protein [Defluviitaleaceae bacterium]MCL2200165.1 AbrB/MazE/SpoVT family DNA-binding domain-containing protein [Defluviitaleaceae bacterium]
MLSLVSKWGNSQGVRISKKVLQSAQISINDEVEIKAKDGMLLIIPTTKKSLAWYLESYDDDTDRYDWGNTDEPKGRELL